MPPRATDHDSQRCANPACDGAPIVAPGSHNRHGKHQPWTYRDKCCPSCGWAWETREEIVPGSIQKSLPFVDSDTTPADSPLCG